MRKPACFAQSTTQWLICCIVLELVWSRQVTAQRQVHNASSHNQANSICWSESSLLRKAFQSQDCGVHISQTHFFSSIRNHARSIVGWPPLTPSMLAEDTALRRRWYHSVEVAMSVIVHDAGVESLRLSRLWTNPTSTQSSGCISSCFAIL